MNIYEKMSAVTVGLNAVAKNLQVGEGRSSYKAVGEADVLAAVKPLEAEHGIYSYPLSRKVIESTLETKTSTYQGNTKEITSHFMRVETVYRFVNIEKPDEYIDITTYGDGIDTNDKAPGKAMTYGDKYALLKAYKIITGEDPDQEQSQGGTIARGKITSAPHVCSKCGKPIADAKKTDGSAWYASDIAVYTTKRFGHPLCAQCGKEAGKAAQAGENG